MAVTRDEVVYPETGGGAVEYIGRCSGEWNRAGGDGARLSLAFHMPSMIYISPEDQKLEGSMIQAPFPLFYKLLPQLKRSI